MSDWIKLYAILFEAVWIYAVTNGKNKPFNALVAIGVPLPVLLRVWGIL